MSRQRMIRPEFFTDEDLTGLPPLTRLLFIGLWTIADREGRLRDRPRTIKFTLFPAEDGFDVDAALDELAAVGCVRRYVVDEVRYLDIPGFSKYQHVHHREQESTYPKYQKKQANAGKPRASTGLAPEKPVASTSTSTSPSVDTKNVSTPGEYAPAYEAWWLAFGRVGNKNEGYAFWQRWVKRGASPDDLLAAATNYRASDPGFPKYQWNARTFLATKNKEGMDVNRWQEWVSPEEKPNGNGGGRRGVTDFDDEKGEWVIRNG